jgi:hypothetical protein
VLSWKDQVSVSSSSQPTPVFRVDVGPLDSQPSHPYTHATNAVPLHSQLYFNLDLILYHGEVWRLATNFLYFGNFSIDFIFHMFFLVRYCKVSVGCVMSCSKQLCSDAGCFHRRAPSCSSLPAIQMQQEHALAWPRLRRCP